MASLVMVVGFGGGHAVHASEHVATADTSSPAAAQDMDHDMDHDMAGQDMDHDMAGHDMDHDMAGQDMDSGPARVASTTSAHSAHQDQLPGVVGDMIETTLSWPIWPIAGTAFVVYALWIATGRADRARCGCTTRPGARGKEQTSLLRLRQALLAPVFERWCAVVMAAGMGVMTFAF